MRTWEPLSCDWMQTNSVWDWSQTCLKGGETRTELARQAFRLTAIKPNQAQDNMFAMISWSFLKDTRQEVDFLLKRQIQPPGSWGRLRNARSWKVKAVWISNGPWYCRSKTIQPGSLRPVHSYSKNIFSLVTFHVYTVNDNTAVDLNCIWNYISFIIRRDTAGVSAVKFLRFHWLKNFLGHKLYIVIQSPQSPEWNYFQMFATFLVRSG